MTPVFAIVYHSVRCDGVSDEDVVDRVVLPAARRNRAADVTGCLWFDQRRFLGVLEGPRDAVEREFQGLRTEPHHREVELLAVGEMTRRRFPRWGIRAGNKHPHEALPDFDRHFSLTPLDDEPDLSGIVTRIWEGFAPTGGWDFEESLPGRR